MASRKAPRKTARKRSGDTDRLVPALRAAVDVVEQALAALERAPKPRAPRAPRAGLRKG